MPRGSGAPAHIHCVVTRMTMRLLFLALALLASERPRPVSLAPGELNPINVVVAASSYRGQAAVRVRGRLAAGSPAGGEGLAVIPGPSFENGSIEVDVAGLLEEKARADARGFIGLAFDVAPNSERFKSFYIRPTNGRAPDQLRRNHSTQYVSFPEFPWDRLRKEEPGVYESYVDLDASAWTHLRVQVDGDKASLYVNRAEQPALIVNDLKHTVRGGAIALWIGAGTDGYFANLSVSPR